MKRFYFVGLSVANQEYFILTLFQITQVRMARIELEAQVTVTYRAPCHLTPIL